jgi:hypothetical protein
LKKIIKPKNPIKMNTKFKQMFVDLTEQLNFINLEIEESIAKSEKSVELTLKAIDKLKKEFLKNKAITTDNEIDLFTTMLFSK